MRHDVQDDEHKIALQRTPCLLDRGVPPTGRAMRAMIASAGALLAGELERNDAWRLAVARDPLRPPSPRRATSRPTSTRPTSRNTDSPTGFPRTHWPIPPSSVSVALTPVVSAPRSIDPLPRNLTTMRHERQITAIECRSAEVLRRPRVR